MGGNLRKKITCICPRCGKTHVLVLFWTGQSTPRKLCNNCKAQPVESVEYQCFREKIRAVSSVLNEATCYNLEEMDLEI